MALGKSSLIFNSSIQSGGRNQTVMSMANMSNLTSLSSTTSLLFNYHQYKKCHSASIPIFLSEAGFLKMITVSDTYLCPLEIFLSSYHLKKLLIKAFQSDTNTVSNIYNLLRFGGLTTFRINFLLFTLKSFNLKTLKIICTEQIL